MTRWRWALLGIELFLFALILILPQIELPDFTFHGGTAPVLAKARFSPLPVLAAVTAPLPFPLQAQLREIHVQPDSAPQLGPPSLLSLLCVLLC